MATTFQNPTLEWFNHQTMEWVRVPLSSGASIKVEERADSIRDYVDYRAWLLGQPHVIEPGRMHYLPAGYSVEFTGRDMTGAIREGCEKSRRDAALRESVERHVLAVRRGRRWRKLLEIVFWVLDL